MRVELQIDPALSETLVEVRAPALTTEVRALLKQLEVGASPLLGFRDNQAAPLAPEYILRFYGGDKKVLAQTSDGTWTARERLYELERRLESQRFARISHSEIVNLRKVTALALSLTSTIRMTLTGGTVCYVSRRYVKRIKEVPGI